MHALVTWTEYKLTSDDNHWLVCSVHLALPCPEQLLLCECTQHHVVPLRNMWTCANMQRSEVAAVYSVLCVLQSQAPSEGAGPTYNLQAIQLLHKPVQVAGPDTSSCCIAAALDHTTGDVTCDLTLK